MELQSKLQTLLAKYNDPLDRPQLQAWEHQLNRLLLASSAAENEGVKALLEQLRSQIAQINDVLMNADTDEISDYQRDRLIDQKKTLNRVIGYFEEAKTGLAQLEAELDKNL